MQRSFNECVQSTSKQVVWVCDSTCSHLLLHVPQQLFTGIECLYVRSCAGHKVVCAAGQPNAGPSGRQSQQAMPADVKVEGTKTAKSKRAASAHKDDSQVRGPWCVTSAA